MTAGVAARASRRLPAVLIAVSAAMLALVSLRYLLPHPPSAPANVMANPFAWPWLPVHAGLSAVALFVGPLQFLMRPAAGGPLHRWLGRLYVACCLFSAPVGLLLAAGATTGPVATAGFGSLAVLWFVTTALGYRAARSRRFAAHRRWMVRSYALTFGAVTLRLYLAVALATHMDFATAYRAIAFLAWVPNLLLAELGLHGAFGMGGVPVSRARRDAP